MRGRERVKEEDENREKDREGGMRKARKRERGGREQVPPLLNAQFFTRFNSRT